MVHSRFPISLRQLLPALLAAIALAGCDQIAVLDGTKAREADGVAVGSACRQAGRAIEDCFTMNPEAPKASVFAGWKEMNDYMVANKLETVTPLIDREEYAKAEEAKAKGETAKPEGGKGDTAHGTAKKTGAHGAEAAPAAHGAAAPVPAAGASRLATAAPPIPGAPPAPGSIALGGQTIPLIVPKIPSPGTATPAAPAAQGHD